MSVEGAGLIGGLAAGRPLLSGIVIAFAVCALSAVGFRQAPPAFIEASISYMAALFLLTVVPVGMGALAPRNFWLRAICAALALGVMLAARRLLLQAGVSVSPLNIGSVLISIGAATFFLVLGAPLWRSAIGLSLIGLISAQLGAAGGLAILSIDAARGGALAFPGPALTLATALGVALSVQIAATYARKFADGGSSFAAASFAARFCAAPALYSLAIGTIAVSLIRVGAGDIGELTMAAPTAAGVIAIAIVAPLFFLPGGLALKAQTEAAAFIENRRREALRPLASAIRDAVSPSAALAACAILSIAAIVAGFELNKRFTVAEVALVLATGAAASLIFVSLRTGLLAAALLAIVGLLGSWGMEALRLAPLTKEGSIIAACLISVLTLQLFLVWRENRNPRRKTREVVMMTLSDSMFSYGAASILAVSVIAGSEIAGLWSEGVEVALFSAAALIASAIISVPLMTAVGALFGRD